MLTCQKHLFQLPDDLFYLNLAYMAPLASSIEQAGIAGLRRRRNPLELGVDSMFDEVDELRTLFARLINTPESERIAVISSASYGMATVARNVSAHAGQNLVVLGEQFPSNYYAWSRLAADTGADLRIVAPPSEPAGRARRWNERLLDAIDASTVLVALPHAHWSDGTLFDLESVRQRTRSVGALMIIDGTQSVGAVPFDVELIEPDALVCASYKTLLGPYSTAFAYFGPRFDDGKPIEETWCGRANSQDFANLIHYREDYRPGAARYDVGERCNFTNMPMVKEALRLLLEWTPERISEYCGSLTRTTLDPLLERGFSIEDPDQRSAQLFGIRPPSGRDAGKLFAALGRERISVSLRGDALRISPHVYNTESDLEFLVSVLLGTASD